MIIDTVTAQQDRDDPLPSRAKLDPMARLAARVVIQALSDFCSGDLLKSLDAFGWLLDECPFWTEALDVPPIEPVKMLTSIRGGRLKSKVANWIAER